MTRLAVDFDGTLTRENVQYWNGEEPEPNENVIEYVNGRYHQGDTVIVHTARSEDYRAQTQRWLDEWGVLHHALRMNKLSADTYLDDKALHPDQI